MWGVFEPNAGRISVENDREHVFFDWKNAFDTQNPSMTIDLFYDYID